MSHDHGPDATSILIVDDLPEKLLIYRTILEELGQNVVAAREMFPDEVAMFTKYVGGTHE